jgi:catechol 2,3-dioxygenase-like lactoylglutathione lyase family enzyme
VHTSGLHHIAITAGDAGVETVARFWREVAGLEQLTVFRRDDGSVRSVWLALEPGGGAANGFLAIEAHDPKRPYGPAMVALRIAKEDRERVLAELKARGVTVEYQSRWTVYFHDPAGNRVGLSHHPHD